jgi:CHASE2 domain-containing sensor protein
MIQRLAAKIPSRAARHWCAVLVLIALGVRLGHWLGERDVWIRLRYEIYKDQQRYFNPRKPWARRTALVMVGDDEYWKGDVLARRVPINRKYLALLLQAIVAADPAVIALDFNLASPTPDGRIRESPAYRPETEQLISVLREIAGNPRGPVVILPRTIEYDPKTDRYIPQSAIYDGSDLPGDRVRSGYIELPFDLRQVPLPVESTKGSELDSFASAIVRAAGEERALEQAKAGKGELPYGSFLERSSFPTYPAQKVLAGDTEVLQSLAHKIVLVGAGWSQYSYGTGGPIDIANSPMGKVRKVYLHANYVEALLNADSQIFKPLPEWIAIAIEVVLSLAVAIIFSLRAVRRFAFLGALLACMLVIGITYFFYQNLGLFFDFFIPLVLLTCHSVYESRPPDIVPRKSL